MNINVEGKYYASMVRKFRTEYKSKNLHGFCKVQKVSYSKMLHCLRNDSYRKPSAKPVSSDEEQCLHPLVVEPADSVTIIFQIEGFSEDAIMILKLFDAIFREDKLIKENLCDVFRRIKKTAKDKLVDLLAHRWQLATVTSWA